MSIIEDARRYQYLRNHVGSEWAESIGTAEECDAAVDAAIAARDGEGHREPPPSAESLSRAIALLAKEKHCGHRATLRLRWTEGPVYEANGFEACDPVYPLIAVMEFFE